MSLQIARVALQISVDSLQLAIVALILVATLVASKLLGGFVSKTFRRINPNLTFQAKRIVIWATWLVGVLLAFDQLGLELNLVLIALAVGVVIIIIASRDFLYNLVARETINLYNQFKIGDWIQVGKVFGRVVDITWNDTVLSTPNNETVYIPNSTITKSIITNRTTQGGIRISVPMTIENSLSLKAIEQTLLAIGEELQEELVPESKPEVRVTKIDAKTSKLELLLKINNPAKGKLISSEVLKRLKLKLEDLQNR